MKSTTNSSPRIAFFAGSMKFGHDGVTRVLYKISEKLRQRNIEHIFFSAIVPPRAEQPVPMYKVPSVAVPFYKEYRLSVGADFKVGSVLHRFKPDILSLNSPCSLGWAAVYYARLHHKPVVAHYHTHFVSYAAYYKAEMLTDLGWQYMKMFYNSVQATYVPTEPILEELSTHGLRRLFLLPHGVDTELFSSEKRSTSWKAGLGLEGKTILLYVGRLVWEKDLATLAAAYSIIRRQRDDVALVLVGDGPARKDLEHLLPDARFLGYRAGRELAACYASADLFVFPSTTETFGMVTLEAMASGLVPVCAAAGGAAGIIEHGVTGMLAAPKDAESFAGCCLELLHDGGRRNLMALHASRYASRQSWDAIVDRMLVEYTGVIGRWGRRKRGSRNKESE